MLSENDLMCKNIAIVGMGVTGQAVAQYFIDKECGNLILVDNDISGSIEKFSNIPNIKFFNQNDERIEEVLEGAEYLVLSPGIPRELEIFKKYLNKGGEIIGEIELAYQLYFSDGKNPFSKVVAVTGTNGKTTSVSFLNEVFKTEKLNVFCGGNIGIPFIKALYEPGYDVIILELSSFQLESIKFFHPHISVLLNIYPNHGERYEDTEDYFMAKWEVMKNMNAQDICFIPKSDTFVSKKYQELKCESKLLDITHFEKVKTKIEKDFDLEKFKLIGAHNIVNLNFCLEVCERLKVSKESFQKSINSFIGLEHRLEVCKTRFEFQVVNDAKSTNLDATMSAIRSLQDEKEIFLIMGGKLRQKGEDISPFAEELLKSVKKIYLIGESAKKLEDEISQMGVEVENCGELSNVIYKARKLDKNSRLLFSPGFPSFDQFKNYADRGMAFKKLVL